MEIYSVNCGSRYFGIEESDSDYDIWIIDNSYDKRSNKLEGRREHLIHKIFYPLDEGIEQLSGKVKNPCWLITLFPKEKTENLINQYLQQHNEEIVTANRKYLYNLLLEYIESYGFLGFKGCAQFRQKAIMYRFLWMDIFIAYAQLGQLKLAFDKVSKNAEYYQNIRKGAFTVDLLIKQNNEKKEQLNQYKNFFNIDDKELQEKFQQDLTAKIL